MKNLRKYKKNVDVVMWGGKAKHINKGKDITQYLLEYLEQLDYFQDLNINSFPYLEKIFKADLKDCEKYEGTVKMSECKYLKAVFIGLITSHLTIDFKTAKELSRLDIISNDFFKVKDKKDKIGDELLRLIKVADVDFIIDVKRFFDERNLNLYVLAFDGGKTYFDELHANLVKNGSFNYKA